MSFEEEINYLENLEFKEDFVIYKGKIPILFSAPHTMEQVKEDGLIKPSESFTKAIALYLNKYFNVSAIVKIKDTGIDSNRDNRDEYKTELLRYIKENNIKLVIDLHGSKKEREFDVEFGTLNNLSADYSTIKELEDSFIKNNITKISHNDPFKGGAITQYIYGLNDVEVIQLEINSKLRDDQNINELEKLCNSLKDFIQKYNKYLNK